MSKANPTGRARHGINCSSARHFSESRRLLVVKPVLLADIGEGIPSGPSPLLSSLLSGPTVSNIQLL